MDGRGIQATLLEGVSASILDPLVDLLEAHRSINFTIPADVDDETLRQAVQALGDAVGYGADVESDLSQDGSLAGVFEVQLVYVEPARMWMEAHFDSDEDWDEDEEDSKITF